MNKHTPAPIDDEDGGLMPVNSREEIPRFANDDEARDFWQTHSVGPGLARYARRPGNMQTARERRRAEFVQRGEKQG